MFWGNVFGFFSSECCFFYLQLCLIFSFPLYLRITSLRDANTPTHSDFLRSCGISTKCHDAHKVMRVGRTDRQWRSLKLPFSGTLNSPSTQRMNQGYGRSFHISLLIIGAVLYRGVVRTMLPGGVSRSHKFTMVLQCCICFKFRFLRPHV